MSRSTRYLRRTLLPCAALAAFVALTLSAAAQVTSAQQSAIRSNCRGDFQSKCSGVTPGGKDALSCLQRNVASLSGGCQTAVRATMPAEAASKVAAPAAAPPAPPPAATAEPAPAAKPATITSAPPPKAKPVRRPVKQATVAPAAQTAAEPGKPTAAQQNAIRQNCRNDFTSKCAGVQPGGAEALSCLQGNVTSLAPGCKAAVSATIRAPGATQPATAMAPAAPAAATPAMVPGGILVEKACARFIFIHCAGVGFGNGPKVACLAKYVNEGNFVGPRCLAALKVTGQLR